MPQQYPFSAVLGCDGEDLDDMGLALVLTTISPEIGGVLIRGEKGTAKSTAVRALAGVLPPIDVYADDRFSTDPADPTAASPDGPFGADATTRQRPVRLVELPVGASEDRVLGSIHLERALSQGKVEYEPGLRGHDDNDNLVTLDGSQTNVTAIYRPQDESLPDPTQMELAVYNGSTEVGSVPFNAPVQGAGAFAVGKGWTNGAWGDWLPADIDEVSVFAGGASDNQIGQVTDWANPNEWAIQ